MIGKARTIAKCSVLVLLVVVAACRTAPIYNVNSSPLATPPGATLDEVTLAMQRAGARLGWVMEEEEPGHLVGRLPIRSHVAVVDVLYNLDQFSINYKSSVNLNAEGGVIHSNYNDWIRNLEQAIRAEVASL